jgi:hypothetical protein
MTGAPSWEQIIWIVTLITATAAFGFAAAWKIAALRLADAELRSKDRHDLRAVFEQQVKSLDDTMETKFATLDLRVKTIEDFRAGTIVILEHMKEFRDEVDAKFDKLIEKRDADMRGLTVRLDNIFNATQMVPSERTLKS